MLRPAKIIHFRQTALNSVSVFTAFAGKFRGQHINFCSQVIRIAKCRAKMDDLAQFES
jgi:hypothetical protein